MDSQLAHFEAKKDSSALHISPKSHCLLCWHYIAFVPFSKLQFQWEKKPRLFFFKTKKKIFFI
jgi:hypothetical protein